MAINLEAVGRQRLDFIRAPMNVKRLITGAAEEVVVMRAVGQLVSRPAARELDFRQPPFANQNLQVPVDGCYPE